MKQTWWILTSLIYYYYLLSKISFGQEHSEHIYG